MLPKLGRSLSTARWARSFSITKSSSMLPHPVVLAKVKHDNNEPPDLPTDENGGHYGMRWGEILHGRYTVVGKLGQGQYSSVWLAKDSQLGRFVAVKVQTIDTNHLIQSNILEDEFALLDRIRSVKLDHPHPGKGCIVPILDHFRLDGPHGVHTCLTFPVLGPSLSAFLYALRTKKVNYELVKRFTTQLLLALAYLHDECKIVHTDLKPANFALMVDNIDDLIRSCLVEGSSTDENFRAASLLSVPPKVELRIPASLQQSSKLSIQLIDFGSANFLNNRLTDSIQPYNLRAPEVFLQAGWGTSADIWSLGCLVFEMITGMILFRPRREKVWCEDTDMLLQMSGYLNEPFPPDLLAVGQRTPDFFESNGQLKKVRGSISMRLCDILDHLSVNPSDRAELEDFLKSMLRLRPTERASAAALLNHAWLLS